MGGFKFQFKCCLRRSPAISPTEIAAQVSSPTPAPLSRTRKKELSLTSMSLHSPQEAIELTPCPQPLEALQKQLEDMQSEFMQKAASFREKGYGYAYKLVTIVHNDNCKVLVHNDDLLALPKNLRESCDSVHLILSA